MSRSKVTTATACVIKFAHDTRVEREKMGLTIQQLGDAVGVGAGWLTRFEKGQEVNPTIHTLERIATTLGMSFIMRMEE